MTKFFQGRVLDYFLDTQGRWAWVWVEVEGERLLVSMVYAPQETTQKKWFWRDLPTNVPDTLNTMMMGDFNTVVQPGLDSPQAGPPRSDAEALRLMMAKMAMEDAFRETWPEEKGFTWIGPGPGRRSRLDMAWVQGDLLHKLLRVVALPVAVSDHKLLLTEFLLPTLVETRAQPPMVPHWMFRDQLHMRLAKQHWEYWAGLRTDGVSATQHFQQGLLEFRRVMLARAKATRQAHLRTGEEYISKMEELGTEPGEGEEEDWWVQWMTVKEQWAEWERQDAERWGLLTKARWARLKERMTAAFFGQGRSKRGVDLIKVLRQPFREDEPEAESTPELLRYVQEFYMDLYTETEQEGEREQRETTCERIWDQCRTTLTQSQRLRLEEEILIPEIERALTDRPRNKAAGPDGMPMDHLQVVGQLIGPLLQEICNSFFRDRQGFPLGFGEADIILLHKKGDSTEIRNWRPVSLLSAPYKLYAKVLANRLTEVLPDLVHPTQTGFVLARQILTNAVMVREVLRRAEESDPPLAVLLLDFEKAYDRVRWGFLLRGMEKRGIGPRFRLAVKDLLGSATATVQINGFRSQLMRVTRSVRQGCPLSPALYILYVEHLHDMLRGDVRIRGLRLPDCRELKSNSFADDTAAFVECSERSVRAVREQVHNFETHAGAKVNWPKSVVMLHEGRGAEYFEDMRMVQGQENTTYLGVLLPAALTSGEQMENLLIEALTRMNRWAGISDVGLLGRVLVANNAVSSTLWYVAPGDRGAFGRQWLNCGVHRVADLWDVERGEWRGDAEMERVLRHQPDRKTRLTRLRQAVPEDWRLILRRNRRVKGEWIALTTEDPPSTLFRVMAQEQEEWFWAEGWEVLQTGTALGRTMIRCVQRDGRIHRNNMRFVAVVRDKKQRKGDSFRPFKISQHPLQIPWDPSMWEWRATNSQRCPMPAHQITTKVIYRSLNVPTDMADEMRERWKKKGWLEQPLVGKWTQQSWEKACALLTMLPDQKQAGGLWLSLQMAVPTYQWMAEYSSATDKDCKAWFRSRQTCRGTKMGTGDSSRRRGISTRMCCGWGGGWDNGDGLRDLVTGGEGREVYRGFTDKGRERGGGGEKERWGRKESDTGEEGGRHDPGSGGLPGKECYRNGDIRNCICEFDEGRRRRQWLTRRRVAAELRTM
ncbi:hypothetical protein CBR_g24013 [Chara braunii]|uniref:Reverse transcriptase domain-containing protein n=1 Tax=Chara braunii TaxID=69332 RepID=A0A388L5J1_CHABU|nr:hypothetical protein CBR_g24013 [Chara braunii]|eukprot:GBG77566.1 hypothetical protein CBR_g24013 [Chara braunii]